MIAEAIRDILLETGGTWPQELHRRLKEKPMTWKRSYLTVVRLIHALETIGLVEFVESRKGTDLLERHIYRIKPGRAGDPRWKKHPLHELYPATSLGAIQYWRLQEVGKVPSGRRDQYKRK